MLSVHYGLKANFPASPDNDALYFCTDTRELFKGSALYTEPARFVSTVPAAKAQGVLYILPTGEIQAYDGSAMQTVALPTTTYTDDGVLAAADTDSTLPTSKRVYESITDAISTLSSSVASTYAPLASPDLTGVPTAPTAASGTNTTQIATTAFVKDAVDVAIAGVAGALHFKGVVATVADLPATGNTEGDVYQVTTNPQGTDAEYVWTLNAGTSTGEWTELGAVIDLSAYLTTAAAASTYAPLASPALTGVPTAPSAAKATDTTQIATTEFVHDVVDDYAPLNSPAFTGTPTAPTNSDSTTDTTQIATTAFVQSVVSAHASDYDAAGSAAAAQSAAITAAETYTDTKLTWGTF